MNDGGWSFPLSLGLARVFTTLARVVGSARARVSLIRLDVEGACVVVNVALALAMFIIIFSRVFSSSVVLNLFFSPKRGRAFCRRYPNARALERGWRGFRVDITIHDSRTYPLVELVTVVLVVSVLVVLVVTARRSSSSPVARGTATTTDDDDDDDDDDEDDDERAIDARARGTTDDDERDESAEDDDGGPTPRTSARGDDARTCQGRE